MRQHRIATGAPTVGLAWGTISQASLVETIEVAARYGFPTIQVPPGLLFQTLETGLGARVLRTRLADAGVKVRVIDGISAGLPGLAAEPVFFKGVAMRFDATACIEAADAIEAPFITASHYQGEPTPPQELADAIGAICRRAAPYGISVVLEFIPDSGIRTLNDAAAMAKAAGEPNCSVLLDVWHLSRSGGTIDDINGLAPNAIGAFQICDRNEPPPDTAYVPMTGRLLPGEGELPLVETVRAALANSPGITIEAEVFSRELDDLPVHAAAARAAESVRKWREGFA